jgi:hypothetical protein
VVGLVTPASYAALTAAVIVWASVRALGASHHVVSSLAVTMLLLLPARWGDGLSVDAWLRRRFGGVQPPPSRRYGFAIWAPAFVFAVTFAAAAWSKLRQPDWVANGSVKYHFISDFNQALVPWGLELAAHPTLAVALSAAAVVAEAVVITAIFSASAAYRLTCGLLALGMLATFALFQGIVWPGWWILLLGFLPWHRFRPGAGATAAATAKPLSAAQLALMAAVVAQQVYASWARVEARPFVSAYDMYSTTYASPAAYEEASNLVYRVVGVTAAGREDLPDCTIDSPAAETFSRAVAGDEAERTRMRSLIGECVVDRTDVTQVGIEGDKKVFDWNARRFVWKRALDVVGPADAAWLRGGRAR